LGNSSGSKIEFQAKLEAFRCSLPYRVLRRRADRHPPHHEIQLEEQAAMNFDDAITAHTQWKMKLSAYIAHPDNSLNASTVSADNHCALGQWIVGDGAKFAKLPEYAKLRTEHTRFHKAASEVVRKASSGQKVAEEVALGSHSEFASASNAVVSAIMAMKAKAH
jgi:Chemoreceptor zinc-binding domain